MIIMHNVSCYTVKQHLAFNSLLKNLINAFKCFYLDGFQHGPQM